MEKNMHSCGSICIFFICTNVIIFYKYKYKLIIKDYVAILSSWFGDKFNKYSYPVDMSNNAQVFRGANSFWFYQYKT